MRPHLPRACESECTRGDIDDPIAVDEIKKFIADRDLNAENPFCPEKKHDYALPIAVIGAGPAGLSCAYYLAMTVTKLQFLKRKKN
jgi:NADPH-dependent glutamate synthase beta subunit-like oxidoreductase